MSRMRLDRIYARLKALSTNDIATACSMLIASGVRSAGAARSFSLFTVFAFFLLPISSIWPGLMWAMATAACLWRTTLSLPDSIVTVVPNLECLVAPLLPFNFLRDASASSSLLSFSTRITLPTSSLFFTSRSARSTHRKMRKKTSRQRIFH